MSRVTCHITMSLDGYSAGPNPTREDPLGEGGERLHEWALATSSWRAQHGREGGERNADAEIIERATAGVGAHIMGRKMFDGGEGPLDPEWKGWWGDEPPFHTPVYVLTRHAREPLELEGGTTFFFVTEGIEAALAAARDAAGDGDVAVAGGASVVQQYLAAGHLDELFVHIAPVFLGGGTPLFANVGDARLEPVEVVGSPAVTHVRYRVARA